MRYKLMIAYISIITVATLPAAGLAQAPERQSPTAKQASSGTRYVVQIGASFATEEKADELTTQLRRQYPSAHTQHPSGGETLYHVRLGPYDTRQDAVRVSAQLAA